MNSITHCHKKENQKITELLGTMQMSCVQHLPLRCSLVTYVCMLPVPLKFMLPRPLIASPVASHLLVIAKFKLVFWVTKQVIILTFKFLHILSVPPVCF